MQDTTSPICLDRITEMTAGDPEFLREIVDMYLEDSVGLVDALRGALQAADAKELKVVAHKLKGSSLNMGVNGVADFAKTLEDHGKAGRCDPHAGEALAQLEAELDRAKEAFAALVRDAA